MRTLALVSIIALTVSSFAVPVFAADLPVKARPAPMMAVAYNWTGCHIGGSVGGKWVRTSGTVDVGPTGTGVGLGAPGTVLLPSADSTTVIAGGQVGCDYQAAGTNWVFGLEGDFHWQRWSRSTALVGPQPFPFIATDVFDLRSDWQASARGRIGYAWDRVLLYVTGGAAFTDVTAGFVFPSITAGGVTFPAALGGSSQTIAGWTIGAGLEYAFVNNWSFGIEGRYSDYGTHRFNGPPLATVFTPGVAVPGGFTFAQTSQSVRIETFEVMAKLNWKIF